MNDVNTVAVITRTKDRELFLERAIQSVHNQTFRDFVHVIINDGGDQTVVENLIEKYKDLTNGRVKLIHNTQSNGMEAASNKAIRSVDSTYVAIHDDDDTWHPEFLEHSVAALDEKQTMGVVVRTGKVLEEIKYEAEKATIAQLKVNRWMPDMTVISLYRQCIDNQMTPITFMYKRSAYNEIGGYDESLPVLGDWDFGIKFLRLYDVEFIDPGFALAFYHHRKPTNTSSDSSFGEGKEKHRYWSNKLMNRYLREELANGRLGVGFIMSQLKYNQTSIAAFAKSFLPMSIVNKLKKRVQN